MTDTSLATLLVSVLSASLLGSLHCAGMCGGLVAFATGSATGERRALPHVAYHAGRLLGYASLGGAAGALGSALDLAGSLAGVANVAAIVSAAVITLWALGTLWGTGWQLPFPRGPQRAFARMVASMERLPVFARALTIGLATGLLPCGWLYAFVVTAAGTGQASHGALVLAAFWLGSVPALLGVGSLAQHLSAGLRRRVPALSAVVLLGLGLSNLWARSLYPSEIGGAAAATQPGEAAPSSAAASAGSTQPSPPEKPSCH